MSVSVYMTPTQHRTKLAMLGHKLHSGNSTVGVLFSIEKICQTLKILSQEAGAMLYQLSYEAKHWERSGQLIDFISSREE